MKTFQHHLRRKLEKTFREGDRKVDKEIGARKLETSPSDCFQFHSCLSQQQSFLQDYSRIATYHRAILLNEADFTDKVVLDVGGSGLLSFFAVQAGAAKVYSVQPGPMFKHVQSLVQSNGLSGRIQVLNADLDSVVCPEKVDVLLSESMGHMLLSDPRLHKVLRVKKWLKPEGSIFPSWADLHFAPFTDEQLYFENYARAAFWQQSNFYGINLSSLHNSAVDEFFRQPVVDTFEVQILMSRSVKHRVTLKRRHQKISTVCEVSAQLRVFVSPQPRLEIPFTFALLQSGLVHGLAFWFDVAFKDPTPTEPLTRWCQVRCLFQTPLFAKMGQTLTGNVILAANDRQSYDIHITATIDQSGFSSGNVLDLKNPFFRMPSWFHS
ncbi:hypothetical protein WMY93_032794 [Mugilogobius chulae]|uniref:Protein arginine N-methyltransferase domain-containing protein n=1 Tax=Mugilogobius chulae TaxID=88201 RepID=A0AAW0MQV3_9GOBI